MQTWIRVFAEMNRRTTLYIERSRQLPLAIIVNVAIQNFISDPELSQRFPRAAWRSLLSCSNRWKGADLVLRIERTMVDDLLECQNKFSMLESMNLEVMTEYKDSKQRGSAFAMAPRLTELKFRHYRANCRWLFPWSQLKKLDIEMYDDWDAVLSQLRNVEELRYFSYVGYPDSDPSSAIRLPHVRFLEAPMIYSGGLFDRFEMPLLEHLCLYGCMPRFVFAEEGWKAQMASLINRSSCRIRCLTLQFAGNKLTRDIAEMLSTSIERLCIKDPFGEVIHPCIRFIADSDDGVHLPNLQELEVICCPGQVSKGCLATILYLLKVRGKASRLALGVVPLKKVTVQFKLRYCNLQAQCCGGLREEAKIEMLDKVMETMCSWSSIADISFDKTHSQISIKPHLVKNSR
ncbi:hypothetical protein F5887DRAFT_1284410 [Amanita rubescens]|nr:hypothetical protein F5887DRAFT_1284410 [Amanita rubescens]